jgi:hypothetical protein
MAIEIIKKNSPSPSLVKVKWSVPNMTKMQNDSIFNMMVTMINGNDVSSLYDTCSDMCKYIHMYQGISFTNDGTCVLWNCYSIKHISCQRCLCTVKHIAEWKKRNYHDHFINALIPPFRVFFMSFTYFSFFSVFCPFLFVVNFRLDFTEPNIIPMFYCFFLSNLLIFME